MQLNFKKTLSGSPVYQYSFAGLLLLVITFLAQVLNLYLPYTSLLLLFIAGVMVVSTQTSPGPAVMSSVLSFLSFNFFFTEPYHTLDVIHQDDIATLVLFLLVALLTVNLASRMRSALSHYQQSLKRLTSFYDFSQKMTSTTDQQKVMDTMLMSVRDMLSQETDVVIGEINDQEVFVKHLGKSAAFPDEKIFRHVKDVMQESRSWYKGWLFFRLELGDKVLGLAAINQRVTDRQSQAIQTFCHLTSVALHRIRLVDELAETKLQAETEQLRSALLSSVSHDLRTPLSSIIGAGTAIIEYDSTLSVKDRQSLLGSIVEEAHRLDRHIQNLLDMTRFGQERVKLERDWVDIHDIINGAIKRIPSSAHSGQIQTDINVENPIIHVHGLLIEQALVNLLDNAVKASPANQPVTINAYQEGDRLNIDITDSGPGIPVDEREKVFDMFYSLAEGDQKAGHGLGLAICRGMVGAHGGDVSVMDTPSGEGTMMRLSLPLNTEVDEHE